MSFLLRLDGVQTSAKGLSITSVFSIAEHHSQSVKVTLTFFRKLFLSIFSHHSHLSYLEDFNIEKKNKGRKKKKQKWKKKWGVLVVYRCSYSLQFTVKIKRLTGGCMGKSKNVLLNCRRMLVSVEIVQHFPCTLERCNRMSKEACYKHCTSRALSGHLRVLQYQSY